MTTLILVIISKYIEKEYQNLSQAHRLEITTVFSWAQMCRPINCYTQGSISHVTNLTIYFSHLTNIIIIFCAIEHVIQNFMLGTFILNYIYCELFYSSSNNFSCRHFEKKNTKGQLEPGKHFSENLCNLSFSIHLFISKKTSFFQKGKEKHVFLIKKHCTYHFLARFSFNML